MNPTVYLALLSAFRVRACLPRYAAAILAGDFPRAYCVVDDAAELGAYAPAGTRERGSEELTALADDLEERSATACAVVPQHRLAVVDAGAPRCRAA